MPKHLRATWPRPEQSHLLPEACSPNGTDNRQQRQRRTKRLPLEPSDILKRFHALYDDKFRYYMKKVSKLYCYYNPLRDMGHICPIAFSSNFPKNLVRWRVSRTFKICSSIQIVIISSLDSIISRFDDPGYIMSYKSEEKVIERFFPECIDQWDWNLGDVT